MRSSNMPSDSLYGTLIRDYRYTNAGMSILGPASLPELPECPTLNLSARSLMTSGSDP